MLRRSLHFSLLHLTAEHHRKTMPPLLAKRVVAAVTD
jgi:hypothetical protein